MRVAESALAEPTAAAVVEHIGVRLIAVGGPVDDLPGGGQLGPAAVDEVRSQPADAVLGNVSQQLGGGGGEGQRSYEAVGLPEQAPPEVQRGQLSRTHLSARHLTANDGEFIEEDLIMISHDRNCDQLVVSG